MNIVSVLYRKFCSVEEVRKWSGTCHFTMFWRFGGHLKSAGLRASPAVHANAIVMLIPEFCRRGPRQRLTVNKRILLVLNDSKSAWKPIDSPHLVRGLRIQRNSLFFAV